MRAIPCKGFIKIRFDPERVPVLLFCHFEEIRDRVFADYAHRASCESAGHTASDDTRGPPGQFYQEIDFRAGYVVIISERNVRSVHQLSEPVQVVSPKCTAGLDRPLILINDMAGSLDQGRIHQDILAALKGIAAQVAQELDMRDGLELPEGSGAFLTADVVQFGDVRVLYVTVRDNDLCITEFKRYVHIGQALAVQKNGMVLFPHRGGELIHNTEIDADIAVLPVLTDQRNVKV